MREKEQSIERKIVKISRIEEVKRRGSQTLQEELHNSRQQVLASMEEVKRLKQEFV